MSCVSSKTCSACGVEIVCDSGGKAGTREGNVCYVWGPCCCGPTPCPACGHDPFAATRAEIIKKGWSEPPAPAGSDVVPVLLSPGAAYLSEDIVQWARANWGRVAAVNRFSGRAVGDDPADGPSKTVWAEVEIDFNAPKGVLGIITKVNDEGFDPAGECDEPIVVEARRE